MLLCSLPSRDEAGSILGQLEPRPPGSALGAPHRIPQPPKYRAVDYSLFQSPGKNSPKAQRGTGHGDGLVFGRVRIRVPLIMVTLASLGDS